MREHCENKCGLRVGVRINNIMLQKNNSRGEQVAFVSMCVVWLAIVSFICYISSIDNGLTEKDIGTSPGHYVTEWESLSDWLLRLLGKQRWGKLLFLQHELLTTL